MYYSYVNLGYRSNNDTVEVKLPVPANVILLSPREYSNYVNGDSFNYYGGYVMTRFYKLPIPYTGHWYLVIDTPDGGTVSATINIFNNSNSESSSYHTVDFDKVRWQIQEENPDCIVKVSSKWCETHPEHGNPADPRTDILVFDKKSGMLHKHYTISEKTGWQMKDWHKWKK